MWVPFHTISADYVYIYIYYSNYWASIPPDISMDYISFFLRDINYPGYHSLYPHDIIVMYSNPHWITTMDRYIYTLILYY